MSSWAPAEIESAMPTRRTRLSLKNVFSPDKSWEKAILDDFAELRDAGLNHPLMDQIAPKFEEATATPKTGLVQDQATP